MQEINIARVCHEANRALCESHGDHSHVPWDDAPDWQKESVVAGVSFFKKHPTATSEDMHNHWWQGKIRDGWDYGFVKDPQAKTHPNMVKFCDLPLSERLKDALFVSIVKVLLAPGGEVRE